MAVGINKAGNEGAAGAVDEVSSRADNRVDVFGETYSQDTAVLHYNRPGSWMVLVHCDNISVLKYYTGIRHTRLTYSFNM